LHNQDFGGKMTIFVARTKFIVNIEIFKNQNPYLKGNSSRISNVLMILHLKSNSTLERVALRCELNVRKYQDTKGFQQQMRLHTATKWSDQNCKLSHVCNFQWIKQECSSAS